MSTPVNFGWYESLLTSGLKANFPPELSPEYVVQEGLDAIALREVLLLHLQKLIQGSLEDKKVEEQIHLAGLLLENLGTEEFDLKHELPLWNQDTKDQLAWLLRAVLDPKQYLASDSKKLVNSHLPRTGFSLSELFSGSQKGLSLDDELRREISTATRVDVLVSFIRWSGLRLLRKALYEAGERNIPVRILTTTYLGATEQKAIEELANLPSTEIRISYNQKRGRLHAKGWVFARGQQLGTAYVGSSNLSRDALQDGLEWNLKITQRQNALVYRRITDTFEGLWQDPEFEHFELKRDLQRLSQALNAAKATSDSVRLRDLPPDLQAQVREHFAASSDSTNSSTPLETIRPFPFQEEALERLRAERNLHGRRRNLVVLPTGSGKTMLAAFDYERICKELGRRPRLLFVAHRREILVQARSTFARVLKDPEFGALWTGDEKPLEWTHLFASVQTIQSYKDEFVLRWPNLDWFEYLVIDEAHHGSADSYQFLLQQVKPLYLLGLTATPERMDGQVISVDFDGCFASEMRLHDGISKNLLCPFHYFGVADGMPDLSGVPWRNGRYVTNDLEHSFLNHRYVESVLQALTRIVSDVNFVHALGFCCSRRHAEFMAESFHSAGLRAAVLTSDSPIGERSSVLRDLEQGRIQYLFSVDLFNEGLDVPVVDTVLFLRPTESLTVFLQQMGRGLRYCPGKEVLTVLDFVSQANKDYDFIHKFSAMLGAGSRHLRTQMDQGYPDLPPGCAIQLEKKAQEIILQHIARQIPSNHQKMIQLIKGSGILDVGEFLKNYPIAPEQLLRIGGLWYQMQRGLESKQEESLCRFVREIALQATSTHQMESWEASLEAHEPFTQGTASDWLCQEWSAYSGDEWETPQAMWNWLLSDSDRREEILWWIRRQRNLTEVLEQPVPSKTKVQWGDLRIFGAYTQKGIKWTLGHARWNKTDVSQSGVERLSNGDGTTHAWILYVNVRKSEKEFSRNTLYQDWAVSHEIFQWESPNNWVQQTGQGKRFLDEIMTEIPVLLFVREAKRDEWRRLIPYTFLGPVSIVLGSVKDERPIGMRFRLTQPMPTAFFRKVCMEMVA